MLITRKSLFSGKERTLDLPVTPQQLEDWTSRRKLIQVAMPGLTPEQREFLMTGTTPEEWTAAFPPEDDPPEPVERKWKVYARGTYMGTYKAESWLLAVALYTRDAGYKTSADAAEACGQTPEEFLADLTFEIEL